MDFLIVFLALAGPFAGSFAALAADRWESGRPILWGRSACDGCGRTLGAAELVPIVSFAAQRGRARCCHAPIPGRLPAAELLGGAIGLWAALAAPTSLAAPTAALGWLLLWLSLVDLRLFLLPDAGTLGLILAGLTLSAAGLTGPPAQHAAAAAAGYIAFAGVGWAYMKLRGVDGLGLGDAKLLAAAGAWTGLAGLLSTLIWASALGLVFALCAWRLQGGPARRVAIPFGPPLAIGFWLTWMLGPLVIGV